MTSKKDYVAVAKILKRAKDDMTDHTDREVSLVLAIAEEFCDHFQKDNPRFNRERFLRACGYDRVAT